jgi:carboxyl-terminal processing protease
MPRRFSGSYALGLSLALIALVSCGGGGGSPSAPSGTGPGSVWTAGVFQPSSTFAARCVSPRSGSDPSTGLKYPDVPGTLLDENNWLRSWGNELYLWYAEIVDQNPASFSTTDAYFQVLKTMASTPSGRAKDRFHFSYVTSTWEALSSSDVDVAYGAYWELVSATPPRKVVVAYTQPNTAAVAASANLARGATVLAVDGVSISDATTNGVATINAGLFPANVNETHTFTIQDPGASASRSVTMTSASVTYSPVPVTTTVTASDGRAVGYILFNDQLASSEAAMVHAFNTLKAAGVADLVLDMRYNGGGFLDVASEVAYMIGGAATAGKVFETQQFNAKYPTTNPVEGGTIRPVLFHTTTQGISAGLVAGQALPTLNLPRVFVLTGVDTCSASEAIINSLRGVNVQVIQIGSTTCGKPYGFYPQDNCGVTYFSIEFSDVNAQSSGAYADGFTPMNSGNPYAVGVPGCSVADDFSNSLGSPSEGRLVAALQYRTNGTCPVATGLGTVSTLAEQNPYADEYSGGAALTRPPWRQMRLLRR